MKTADLKSHDLESRDRNCRWRKHLLHLAVSALLPALAASTCFSQLLKAEPERKQGDAASQVRWTLSNGLEQALAHNVVAGPKLSPPASSHQSSSLIGLLKKQRNAAQFTGGVRPGAGGGMANNNGGMLMSPTTPTLLAGNAPGSTPMQTQSAVGTGGAPGTTRANTGASGSLATRALHPPPPILACLHPSIKDVDGSPSGIVFSPGYTYTIHGCGFGNAPGAVYLMGVKQQTTPVQGFNTPPPSLHSDWVQFLIPGAQKHQTQMTWTDTQVQATVDPNTSGFYDSSSATLVVIPGGSTLPTIQAHNFSFLAARADQLLKSLPRTLVGGGGPTQLKVMNSGSSLALAHVIDSSGHNVAAQTVVPSDGSLILPGHTLAVVREDNAAPFPANSDSFDFTPGLAPGFELKDVQFFHADLTPANCSSSGAFSTNGNWNTSWYVSRFHVAWQEQSCSPNSISAYALDVTVEGPRGVSPF